MKHFTILFALALFSTPAFSSDSLLGKWKHSETFTPWMQTKPQTFVSSIDFSKKKDKLYAKIDIESDHMCSTQGFAKISGDLIHLDTSFKENKGLGDFTNASESKPCKVTIKKHSDFLTITSESPGCSSECGAKASFTSDNKFKK